PWLVPTRAGRLTPAHWLPVHPPSASGPCPPPEEGPGPMFTVPRIGADGRGHPPRRAAAAAHTSAAVLIPAGGRKKWAGPYPNRRAGLLGQMRIGGCGSVSHRIECRAGDGAAVLGARGPPDPWLS